MKISDWNLENYKLINVMFDITNSKNSLLCQMTVEEIQEMIDKLEQILEEKLQFEMMSDLESKLSQMEEARKNDKNMEIYEFFLSLKEYIWDTDTQEKFEEFVCKLHNELVN